MRDAAKTRVQRNGNTLILDWIDEDEEDRESGRMSVLDMRYYSSCLVD